VNGAGKSTLTRELAARDSFAIETTLAGSRTLRLMNYAQLQSYEVVLMFIGTNSVEINLLRVGLLRALFFFAHLPQW
jgi:predicted ABC-type ATPase